MRELFGGPGGCSHLGALLQALGPVAVQASWSLATLHDDLSERPTIMDAGPEERERRARMNADTCHVWADGGEHLHAVVLGQPRHPQWQTERLRRLGIEPG